MNRASRVFAQLALVIVLAGRHRPPSGCCWGANSPPARRRCSLLHSLDAFAESVEGARSRVTRAHAGAESCAATASDPRTELPVAEPDELFAMVPLIEGAARARRPRSDRRTRFANDRAVAEASIPGSRCGWFRPGARVGARQFSVLLLAGCALLVLLAAACACRRLAQPLKALAAAAPALVRGEDVGLAASGARRARCARTAIGAAARQRRGARSRRRAQPDAGGISRPAHAADAGAVRAGNAAGHRSQPTRRDGTRHPADRRDPVAVHRLRARRPRRGRRTDRPRGHLPQRARRRRVRLDPSCRRDSIARPARWRCCARSKTCSATPSATA